MLSVCLVCCFILWICCVNCVRCWGCNGCWYGWWVLIVCWGCCSGISGRFCLGWFILLWLIVRVVFWIGFCCWFLCRFCRGVGFDVSRICWKCLVVVCCGWRFCCGLSWLFVCVSRFRLEGCGRCWCCRWWLGILLIVVCMVYFGCEYVGVYCFV